MTQEWITQYNKKCAEFLFPELVDIDDTGIWGINICLIKNKQTKYEILNNHDSNIFISIELKFHSDWNWIMEVIDKIESIKGLTLETCNNWIGEFTIVIRYSSYSSTHYYSIKKPRISEGQDFRSKKEAVIQAIDQFIDWYNKQEES